MAIIRPRNHPRSSESFTQAVLERINARIPQPVRTEHLANGENTPCNDCKMLREKIELLESVLTILVISFIVWSVLKK